MTFSRVFVLAALFAGNVVGHTWIDQLVAVKNGLYTGDFGYPRGYVSRTDPGFTGDSDNYLLPPLTSGRTRIDSTDLLCHPSQRAATQSSDTYPRLQVTPGTYVAMKYTENGHVTLPENQLGKPPHGGTVFVFGTTQPKDDEKISDVLEWTHDGSGGDKRGVLLAAQNFDDGRCYQINSSPASLERQAKFPDPTPDQPGSVNEQWCESDVKIPESAPAGKPYTVYWVWQWPTADGVDPTYPDGKDEYYSTCSDVDIVADPPTSRVHTLVQQDPQTEAVSDYQSRTAATENPLASETDGPSSIDEPTASSAVAAPTEAPTTAPSSPPAPTSAPAATGVPDIVTSTITEISTVTASVPTSSTLLTAISSAPALAPSQASSAATGGPQALEVTTIDGMVGLVETPVPLKKRSAKFRSF